jgi:hypothetical protein
MRESNTSNGDTATPTHGIDATMPPDTCDWPPLLRAVGRDPDATQRLLAGLAA